MQWSKLLIGWIEGSGLLFQAVVLFSLIVGLASGGKIRSLANVKLENMWWIAASFVIRFAPGLLFTGRFVPSTAFCIVLSLAVYFLLFYGLYPSIKLPGFLLLATGSFLNFLVIMANGGRMPVDISLFESDLQEAAFGKLSASFTHKPVFSGVNLRFLADVFAWKIPPPKVTAFSIGDVLMAVGIFWFVLHVMHSGFPDLQKDVKIV